jgi:hypothetical protein
MRAESLIMSKCQNKCKIVADKQSILTKALEAIIFTGKRLPFCQSSFNSSIISGADF